MQVNNTTIALLLTLAAGISFSAQGQLFRRRHMKQYEPAPKVMLVQLPTFQRMAQHYLKAGQARKATEVRVEAELAAKAMIKDFKYNFHYCRVYFFYDTNAALIQEGKTNKILFDADNTPVNESELSKTEANFLVVFYGFAQQEGSMVETRQGLVVMGPDYEQKASPFPYRVFPSADPGNKLYSYSSKKYEIEYIAAARELDKTLRKYYDESWRDYSQY